MVAMGKIKCFFFLMLVLLAYQLPINSHAQELNCNVKVITEGADITDRRVFDDMKTTITNFMNFRRWSNDVFVPDERIACNMVITITKVPSIGNYEATVQIQSARPIYGTNYESVILNYVDKDWSFSYVEGQNMEYNEGTFSNNLTSLLAFYALVIVGLDYDTFSKLGGKEYLQRAQNIATNAIQGGIKGWQAFDGTTNRYWLIENLLNQQMQPFREELYNYHRLGLDNMARNKEAMPTIAMETIKKIQQLQQVRPISVILNNFFNAKHQELVGIFQESSTQVKGQAVEILSRIDPLRTETYQRLTESR